MRFEAKCICRQSHSWSLNKQREKAGEPLFANPRNAAAGSLKLLDSRITAQRNLSFFAYASGEISKPLAKDHYEMLQIFKKLGLPVNPNIKKAKNIDEVIEICNSWDKKREKLDYQIDGMVVKVNNLEQREILGFTGRSPRWCISYKFAAEQAETKVESIVVQVGKGGTLTPVANLTPVLLAGTTVKRASPCTTSTRLPVSMSARATPLLSKKRAKSFRRSSKSKKNAGQKGPNLLSCLQNAQTAAAKSKETKMASSCVVSTRIASAS